MSLVPMTVSRTLFTLAQTERLTTATLRLVQRSFNSVRVASPPPSRWLRSWASTAAPGLTAWPHATTQTISYAACSLRPFILKWLTSPLLWLATIWERPSSPSVLCTRVRSTSSGPAAFECSLGCGGPLFLSPTKKAAPIQSCPPVRFVPCGLYFLLPPFGVVQVITYWYS